MRKWAVWVVVVAALAGGGISWIALGHYYRLLNGDFGAPSFCNISEQFNCDIVTTSSYATLFGQPVAGIGLLYFCLQGLFGIWVLRAGRGADRRPTAMIGICVAGAALLYPAYLAVIMVTRLHTLCLTCLGIDAALVGILAGWCVTLNGPVREWGRLLRGRIGAHAGVAAAVGGVGIIFLASATQAAHTAAKEPRLSKAALAQAVAAYQKGSLFDLTVDPTGHPLWGNPNAKVTVVEFSDFQCPFCKEAALALKAALAEFRNDVRFLFFHYPLDASCNTQIEQGGHPFACLAARAARCAHDHGRFWEYHDGLFRHQEKLSREVMITLAGEEGFDRTKFTACLDAPATDTAVKADIAIGQHIHIRGTPTILVNNRQVVNWRSRALLRTIIRAELGQ